MYALRVPAAAAACSGRSTRRGAAPPPALHHRRSAQRTAAGKKIIVPSKPFFPGPEEEKEVSHEAFLHAFEATRPLPARVPGLQQFAASVWERRRRIPSTTYNDPLDHIFTEFDRDSDGHLTAQEIADALQSRNVEATAEQVQAFIDACDEDNNGTVERNEFANFIFHMAVADLKHDTHAPDPSKSSSDE